MAEGRSKRRCVLRKTAVPSSIHYVGYVEEEETPEMIMRKFEELERIMDNKKSKAADGNQSDAAGCSAPPDTSNTDDQQQTQQELEDDSLLDADQLQEIFKATSIFSVKSVLGNNEVLLAGDHGADGERGAYSDGDFSSGGWG